MPFQFSIKQTRTKVEPSQEGFFLIAAGAIAALVGIKIIANKISSMRENKNPALIIDRYFGKTDYPANCALEYPVSTKDNPIVINKDKQAEYIDILRDSDGWYHPSKSKWIPCQTLSYWLKHFDALLTFVTGFAKLINSKQVDKDTQALSDRVFGKDAFIGKSAHIATSISKFRRFSVISDKKNGYDPSSLLGFPNEWSSDVGYKKGDLVNTKRQKIVEACKALKTPINEALKTGDKTEDQLKQQLIFLQLCILILDSVKHDLSGFDYDADQYTDAIESSTGNSTTEE